MCKRDQLQILAKSRHLAPEDAKVPVPAAAPVLVSVAGVDEAEQVAMGEEDGLCLGICEKGCGRRE